MTKYLFFLLLVLVNMGFSLPVQAQVKGELPENKPLIPAPENVQIYPGAGTTYTEKDIQEFYQNRAEEDQADQTQEAQKNSDVVTKNANSPQSSGISGYKIILFFGLLFSGAVALWYGFRKQD